MSKLTDATASLFYSVSLEGGCDEECGSSSEAPGRWYGLLRGPFTERDLLDFAESDEERAVAKSPHVQKCAGIILTEDSQGFVDYTIYSRGAAEQMAKAWSLCEADCATDGGGE